MQPWTQRIASLMVLTIGLIACFVPSQDEVVDIAAARLPTETPFFAAISEPEMLVHTLAELFASPEWEPRLFQESGIDFNESATLARLPGPSSFWMLSFGVNDSERAEEGLSALINPWAAAHRVVLDGARVFALVSLSPPDKEGWREAARALEAGHFETSLAHAEHVEPLAQDALMLYLNPMESLDIIKVSPLVRWSLETLDACTLRARTLSEGFEGNLRCPSQSAHPLVGLIDESTHHDALGEELEAGLHMQLQTDQLSELWESLAEVDERIDQGHTWWLDLAAHAGVSPRAFLSEVLSGQLTLALSTWPSEHAPAGLMARVGLSDRAKLDALLEAISELFEKDPGARLESDSYRGIEGKRVEWLRHRGHDLSWARVADTLLLTYGRADLEDALKEVDEAQWEAEGDNVSAWIDLAATLDLEGLVDDLNMDIKLSQEALGINWTLRRVEGAESPGVLRALFEHVLDSWERRQRQALRQELSRFCDAIDLHAIEHGLPIRLSEVVFTEAHVDPWGRPFVYTRPAIRRTHHRYDLCSLGPDGVSGTADDLCYE